MTIEYYLHVIPERSGDNWAELRRTAKGQESVSAESFPWLCQDSSTLFQQTSSESSGRLMCPSGTRPFIDAHPKK